jgi:lipoyl-dependent peroxiredoxin
VDRKSGDTDHGLVDQRHSVEIGAYRIAPAPTRTETTSEATKEADMPAKGSAEWKGDVPTGTGTFTAGDTISGGYTYKSRFEDGPGSNPEQLIAAAHAACFSMALSNLLAQAGNPPESVHTDATVTLRLVEGAPTITKIDLVTVGRVPGVDQAAFAEHARTAKEGCPVSRALAGVPEITLDARLSS